MSKTRSKAKKQSKAATAIDQLQELLAEEDALDEAVRHQVDFWAQYREQLAVNGASTGLEILDDLAVAVLNGSPTTLPSTVHLLPPPSTMADGQVPDHPVFSPPTQPAAARSSTGSSSSAGSSKVKRASTPSKRNSKKPKYTVRFSFHLQDDTPQQLKADLADLLAKAEAQGKEPYRIAYPWRDQRAWYDPSSHRELHLLHWRFWMRFRQLFFELAIYAPTTRGGARRKLKLSAIQARIRFLSYNIEEFGYYKFLSMVETGSHDMLLWLGGKAAKHSVGAKGASGPTQQGLDVLLKHDRSRYDRVLARALDPQQIDEDGFASVPEQLEQTQLLDPRLPVAKRLSDKALARVKLDVTSSPPPVPSWVGNRTRGPWKALLSDRSLRQTQVSVADQILKGQSIAVYDEKTFKTSEQGPDDSDFEDDDGFAAQPPTPPVTMSEVSDQDEADDDQPSSQAGSNDEAGDSDKETEQDAGREDGDDADQADDDEEVDERDDADKDHDDKTSASKSSTSGSSAPSAK